MLHNNTKKPQSSLCEAGLAVFRETLRGDAQTNKPKKKSLKARPTCCSYTMLRKVRQGSTRLDWKHNDEQSGLTMLVAFIYYFLLSLKTRGMFAGMSPVLLQGKRRELFGTHSHTQMAANRMSSVDSYLFFFFMVICTT